MTQPDNRGGYRPPAKPAPVSGPGRLSKRTDGQGRAQLPDAAYGEQKTFQDIQGGAPMAQAGGGPQGPGMMPLDMSRTTPFTSPSQYPGEPVTAGADAGLGPGSGVLPKRQDPGFQNLIELLPTLEVMASMPDATSTFRNFVRRVRGNS